MAVVKQLCFGRCFGMFLFWTARDRSKVVRCARSGAGGRRCCSVWSPAEGSAAQRLSN